MLPQWNLIVRVQLRGMEPVAQGFPWAYSGIRVHGDCHENAGTINRLVAGYPCIYFRRRALAESRGVADCRASL
jgi:hypothetical protein